MTECPKSREGDQGSPPGKSAPDLSLTSGVRIQDLGQSLQHHTHTQLSGLKIQTSHQNGEHICAPLPWNSTKTPLFSTHLSKRLKCCLDLPCHQDKGPSFARSHRWGVYGAARITTPAKEVHLPCLCSPLPPIALGQSCLVQTNGKLEFQTPNRWLCICT